MSQEEGEYDSSMEPSPLVSTLTTFQNGLQQLVAKYYQGLETDLALWSDLNKEAEEICSRIAVLREEESQRLGSALAMIQSLSEQANDVLATETREQTEEGGQRRSDGEEAPTEGRVRG